MVKRSKKDEHGHMRTERSVEADIHPTFRVRSDIYWRTKLLISALVSRSAIQISSSAISTEKEKKRKTWEMASYHTTIMSTVDHMETGSVETPWKTTRKTHALA